MKNNIFLLSLLLYVTVISPGCESTPGNSETVMDVDGNSYSTVVIGNQVWMQENLRTTRYNDGTPISQITDDTEWRHQEAPAYTLYENEQENKEIYGLLYNWHAVGDGLDLCPEGWFVPSDDDWKILEHFLGMSSEEIEGTGMRGTAAGGKLKKTGTTEWNDTNVGASNETGFTAIPSGRRDGRGEFIGLTASFTAWTSTETSRSSATYRHLPAANEGIGRNPEGDKKVGFAVRCMKEQ